MRIPEIDIRYIPVLVNGIYDDIGVKLHDVPFTTEKIRNAIKEKAKEDTAQKVTAFDFIY